MLLALKFFLPVFGDEVTPEDNGYEITLPGYEHNENNLDRRGVLSVQEGITSDEKSEPDRERGEFFTVFDRQTLYLKGVPRIENNRVDVFKIPKGLSIFRRDAYFQRGFTQDTRLSVDYEEKRIVLNSYYSRNITLYHPVEMTFDRYLENIFRTQFRSQLAEQVQQKFIEEVREADRGLIPQLVLDLPPLPGAVRKFIGDRPTRLSLTGTQRLTFSGSSTKRDDRRLTETGEVSDFNLKMKQELNLLLRGTIGDKITVNVRHSSESDLAFMDPSTIEIEYQGDEDEIIQSIKGGNISLSLTGSEFIRYSASSTGLFGVRTDLKFGDLEITAIASKEEAQKHTRRFTGTDAADSLHYRSSNYSPRTHYYIHNPYELFALYRTGDADTLAGYVDNAIRTNEYGAWMLQPGSENLLPDPNEPFTVYLNRGIAYTGGDVIQAWEVGEEDVIDDYEPYDFEILEVNADYFIDFDTGILTMNMAIDRRFTIAVSYTKKDGRRVGGYVGENLFVKMIRRENQGSETDTWPLQMRNLYNLNRRNIQNDGFRLNFFTYNPDGTINYYIDESIVPGGIEYNEYLRLDTNGDGLINGFDETVNLAAGYVILPMIEPFKAFSDRVIYERDNPTAADRELITINMAAVGKVGRDRIELGQMNILPGSVRVVVDGETLQENVHYIVDYEFGHVSFLTEKGRNPDSSIEINYEYRPFFAAEAKTLFGVRADWKFSDVTRLGGTFIYHSEKVADKRPRIGNENRTLIMSNIDGRIEFDPPLFTKLVDMIPLIRTDAPSLFRLSGEVAMTLPRIYGHKDQTDRKEAYIDDMEGNVDSYPLGLSRLNWSSASKPVNTRLMRARPNWYNPDDVLAEDIYDPEFLTEKERKERQQVLTLRTIPPDVSNPNITNQYWGGIMRYLGNEIDFSDKKYIEVLVRVHKYPDYVQAKEPSVTLHIDLGDISEDFYVWNGGKGVLNTEDGANGGMRDGILEPREDVGLDGIPEGEPGDDPYDRFSIEQNEYGDYPWINGTSGNGILDTEDLNGNGVLDTLNRYFQYTVNLQSESYESEHKGWRLYRIPMDRFVVKSETGRRPDLRAINYARVWMQTDELARVQIARLHVVGNRWREGLIKDEHDRIISRTELDNNNEFLSLSVVDNQNNRDHYVSPPNVELKEDGVPLLEQALAVDYNNLQKNHYGLVIRRFRDNQNLLAYGKIRFWTYLESKPGYINPADKDKQEIILRIGADSLNYYEVRYPATPVGTAGHTMEQHEWRDIEIDFTKLTSLKQHVHSHTDTYETKVATNISGVPDSVIVRIVGNRVTLTNIREISAGLINRSETVRNWTGRLYINDIRVADPYEDIGFAARSTLNVNFADFSTLNVGLIWRSENFNTNVSRTARPTNEETLSLNITNRYNLHKFFPQQWGINLPLTLTRNQTRGIPRYKANSDILREDIEDKMERDREKRESLSQTGEIAFNQTRDPKSRILRYTIRNTSIRGNIRHNKSLTSTAADTTLIYSGTVNYNLSLPRELIGFNIIRNYRLNYFPHSFNNTVSYRAEKPKRWRWNTSLPDTVANKWTPDRYTTDKKDLTLSTAINYDIFPSLKSSYNFSQKRDMMYDEKLWDNIPFGKETERDQNLTLSYTPGFFKSVADITTSVGARYREVQRPFRESRDADVTRWDFDGNVTRNSRVNVRLKNRDLLNSLLDKYGIRTRDLPSTTDQIHDDESVRPFGDDYHQTPDNENGMFDEHFDYDAHHQQEMDRLRELEEERQAAERDTPIVRDDEKREEKTKEERALWAVLLSYFARMENLNINYENTYGSRYSRFESRPPFLYQLGLPDQIEDEKDNLDMKDNRDNFSVTTGYPFFTNLTSTWSFSRTVDRRYSSASQKEITTVFPNVRLTLTGFEKLIRAESFMTSSRLSSSYTYTERVRGAIDWDRHHWDKPTGKNETHSFSPLLSWQTNWRYRISSTVSYNHSETSSTTYRETYTAEQKTTNRSVTSNLSWSFRSPQGLKIPFFTRKLPITNELTTDVSFNWEKSKSKNKGREQTIIERDTEKYRVSPRITYNFSRNIKGGLQSSYEKTHDNRRDEGIRTFSLSIWAEINF